MFYISQEGVNNKFVRSKVAWLRGSLHSIIVQYSAMRAHVIRNIRSSELSEPQLVLQRGTREDNITRMHLRMRASNDFGIVTTPRVLHVCA